MPDTDMVCRLVRVESDLQNLRRELNEDDTLCEQRFKTLEVKLDILIDERRKQQGFLAGVMFIVGVLFTSGTVAIHYFFEIKH